MPLESALDKKIQAYAKARGAYGEKLYSNAMKPGMPDHLIGYKGRFIYLEAKVDTALRTRQRLKMRQARAAGCIAEVAYGTEILGRIFDAIDVGKTWEPETDLDAL